MSIIRNRALTWNLLSFCSQDQCVPTSLGTSCLWNQHKRISSAVSPLKLLLLAMPGSNLPFSPLQQLNNFFFTSTTQGPQSVLMLSFYEENHNKQDNWLRFSFSPTLESSFKFPVPTTSAELIYCTATQNQTDTPSPTADLWFRNIWSNDMKRFTTSAHSKSIGHNGIWQPVIWNCGTWTK